MPGVYRTKLDPSRGFATQKEAEEYDAQLRVQQFRERTEAKQAADAEGEETFRNLTAPGALPPQGGVGMPQEQANLSRKPVNLPNPSQFAAGTPTGSTKAGTAIRDELAAGEAQKKSEAQFELVKKGVSQYADKYEESDPKFADFLRVGVKTGLFSTLKDIIEVIAEYNKSQRSLKEIDVKQKGDIDLEGKKQKFEAGESEKDRAFEQTESEKERIGNQVLEAMRIKGKKEIATTPKPVERKSTTTSAKIVSDVGFGLGKLQTLRGIVKGGDADVFNTTMLGEFTDPALADAILQLNEFHGREQSGAAISNSEWKNFRKQILNRKFLLTKEGKKAALDNIDDFIGRYYAKGELVAGHDGWYEEYNSAKNRGVSKLSGEPNPDNAVATEKPANMSDSEWKELQELEKEFGK